jgi:uncharacterized protein YkwD
MQKFYISIALGLFVFILIPQTIWAETEPVSFVRRSEAAMILLKNAGVEVELGARSKGIYPDIIDGQWYVPHMLKGIEKGILDVSSSGFTYPHRSVSRIEFLKMMSITFGLSTNLSYQYTDINPDSENAKYAGLSWRYNLFSTTDKSTQLQPNMRISHLEAARAIYTLLKAEPSLQSSNGLIPTKIVPTGVVSVKPTLVPLQLISAEGATDTAYKGPGILMSLSTPTSIKNATLKLLTSRRNLASQTRNDLIAAVNEFRAAYKLGPLRANYYLELSGQRHAKDMADRGYFSHYTPEGLSYVDRIRAGGYLDINPDSCSCSQQFDLGGSIDQGPNYLITGNEQCSCDPRFSLGENLAKGQLTVKQVMDDWKNSSSHRINMLRPEFEEIGIGLYEDVWVQQFGRLKFE